MRYKFCLQSANYGRGIEVRLLGLSSSGEITAEARKAVFENFEEGTQWSAPLVTIEKDTAQNLMDELWMLGFRPERGELSVGQVAATEKHLLDMRTIVFSKLEIQKP